MADLTLILTKKGWLAGNAMSGDWGQHTTGIKLHMLCCACKSILKCFDWWRMIKIQKLSTYRIVYFGCCSRSSADIPGFQGLHAQKFWHFLFQGNAFHLKHLASGRSPLHAKKIFLSSKKKNSAHFWAFLNTKMGEALQLATTLSKKSFYVPRQHIFFLAVLKITKTGWRL